MAIRTELLDFLSSPKGKTPNMPDIPMQEMQRKPEKSNKLQILVK